jgi:hypothetical protein
MKQLLRWGGIGMIGVAAILLLATFIIKPEPEGGLEYRLIAKDRVISGVYKVYGAKNKLVSMWLAKAVFRNSTESRLTKLKVRYRVAGYADWSSWHTYAAVDPGQTVVDVYYPIFTEACAKLTSPAPAELQIEYEYIAANGYQQQNSEARPLTMLSRYDLILSDLTAEERTLTFQDTCSCAPLAAAWVSRGDEVVARLASIANKKAGGIPSSQNYKYCRKVMEELYKIMCTIHISYQTPAHLADPNMSYDMKLVQHLQYPRDTIQKRSGTCIDLAILYATMLHSVGIKPYLVFKDGHCFPMGMAPNGSPIFVEATSVSDGYGQALPFDKAVEDASKTWESLQDNGRFILVDVEECWVNGISNPELEPLPPDILEKWGIMALVEEAEKTKAAPAGQVVGSLWAYVMRTKDGRTSNGQFQISGSDAELLMIATAAYSLPGPDGAMHSYNEEFAFIGKKSGRNLVAQARKGTITMDGQQMPAPGLPFLLKLTIASDGRSMQGQLANAQGQKAAIYLQRQQ